MHEPWPDLLGFRCGSGRRRFVSPLDFSDERADTAILRSNTGYAVSIAFSASGQKVGIEVQILDDFKLFYLFPPLVF